MMLAHYCEIRLRPQFSFGLITDQILALVCCVIMLLRNFLGFPINSDVCQFWWSTPPLLELTNWIGIMKYTFNECQHYEVQLMIDCSGLNNWLVEREGSQPWKVMRSTIVQHNQILTIVRNFPVYFCILSILICVEIGKKRLVKSVPTGSKIILHLMERFWLQTVFIL